MLLILQIAIGVALAPVVLGLFVLLTSGVKPAIEFVWFMFTHAETLPVAITVIVLLVVFLGTITHTF